MIKVQPFRKPTRGLALALCALLLSAAGCKTTRSSTTLEQEPPIVAQSPEVQAEFEDAVALLNAGEYDQAAERLRLLQAENADDRIAQMAELYIARALIGDIDARFKAMETGQWQALSPEVERLLAPLASATTVDERVRFGAAAYLALSQALNAQAAQSASTLRSYPGPSMSPAILEKDRPWIWPLIAEGLQQADRPAEAIEAWARTFEALRPKPAPDQRASGSEQAPGDAPGNDQPSADDADNAQIQAYADGSEDVEFGDGQSLTPGQVMAVARAFDAADALEDRQAAELLNAERPFVRALATWAYVRREARQGIDEREQEALLEIFNENAPYFLEMGVASRAAELSMTIASLSEARRLVVGALLPLSGPNRAVGYRALSGMLIAQQSFHVAGEPAVTLVIEDSAADPAAALQRLVDLGVLAVVGPLDGRIAAELREPAADAGVPMIALAPEAIEGGDDERTSLLFRNFLSATSEARAMATLSFEQLHDRRAAVVYPDMGYGRVMAQAFADEFRARGGQIVAEVAYDRSSSNFVDTAKAVARANPDALFIPDSGSKIAQLSAFMAQENIWGHAPDKRPGARAQRTYVHYLGTSLWQDPIVTRQAASYVEGALIPAWYSSTFDDADTRQFSAGFEAVYERGADYFEAFAYDSVKRLRELMVERGAGRTQTLVSSLRGNEWAGGATGRYRFDERGEPIRELRMLQVKSGEWAAYERSIMTPLHRPAAAITDDDGSSP
ncbi:ABC transporter substrate-binding protein [Lujinxingia vulgaris]|uniref:ABC transporter substrate-binding protein n=1 Tax=Lujinxingia vulgaris TaxID=2600176 RepID=A0A5C6XC00_9DELT|nr:penicillin-binding protein activator [Lujinxingia vulgaris]TXD39426.1 ABC transporter substrate-binding protein [Lujinxingia vulgaris]